MRSLFLAALSIAACAPPVDDDDVFVPPPDGSIAVGLRASDGAMTPVEDGADLELIAGAQGGYHLELAATVDGMGDRVEVVREVRRDDTGVLVAKTRFVSDVVGGRLDDGPPTFLCPAPIGISVAGEPLRVEYLIDDVVGTLAFRPTCPAGDAFCDRICR